MSLPQPTSRSETSVRRQLLLPFFAYFLLLASTSFIAGGIVHLGLGENTAYYLALAVLGVVCFTVGNYLQEFVLRKKTRPTNLGAFLLVSFVLSVGMGMMTGGVQHYLDNPAYSSVLIPVGLILAVLAFLSREAWPQAAGPDGRHGGGRRPSVWRPVHHRPGHHCARHGWACPRLSRS